MLVQVTDTTGFREIALKVEKRDVLTDRIISLQSKIEANTEKLIKLTNENLSRFETGKQLTSLLLETKNNKSTSNDPKYKSE